MTELITENAAATESLGCRLGAFIKEPVLITLEGELAAGKTVFAKGYGRGMGITNTIKSPTYTYMCQYEGKMPLYHIDAYNIPNSDAFEALGLEEILYEPGVILLEWPSQVEEILPCDRLSIRLEKCADREDARILTFTPRGERYENILEEWLAHENFGL